MNYQPILKYLRCCQLTWNFEPSYLYSLSHDMLGNRRLLAILKPGVLLTQF